MVLINNLTIDEINAALLHLQRARTEVVGGTKGSTVQNITISNKGGGSTVDYAPTITALSNRIDKNTDDIESVEDEIDKIQETLEQLSDNGISSMTFDPVTRQLQINTQDGEVYSCDITSENITLNFDATTNKLTLEMGEQYQEVTLPYINANEKGSANGVATLDSSGRVPYSQLPESAMEFLGNWNASTNTPHLQDGTGTNGDFYVCNVGGTVTFGTGNTQTFVPNDRVIYNGTSSQWVKLPAGQVSSVNGMSGDVTLTASDINYSAGVTIKDKIDANAPVQSDWNVTDTTSLAYIKNKPTIPASPVQSDWNVTDTTSLAYIKNKPSVAVLGNTAGCGLGTASAGSCTTAARSDHVHPVPTSVPYAVIGGYLGERAALGCAPNCTYGIANVWNYCNDSRYYLIGTKYDTPSCKYNVRVDYATSACNASWASCNGSGVPFGSAAVCDATKFVPKRTNEYLYNPALATYWGSSGGKYFRIEIPKGSAIWAMVALEVSLRTYGGVTNNYFGKILIHGYWSSSEEWNHFTYSVLGTLHADAVKVYGSDKKYIYIYTNTTYTTASVDKVLLGDNITNYDVSAMAIDTVSSLPATYQTATLLSQIADVSNGCATTFAYSKQGLQSNPSWLAGWNGYELRAVSPSVVCVNSATWVKGDTMRPTNSNLYPKSTNGSLTHFLATSSMTTGNPGADGHIIHMSWDNAGGWGAQLFLGNSASVVPQYRSENGGTWTSWHNFITSENIGSQHVACADCASCAGTVMGECVCGWDWIGACARIYRVLNGVYLFQIYGNTCEANVFEAFCRFVCSRNLVLFSTCYHSLCAMGTATQLNTCHCSIGSVCWDESSGDMYRWTFHGAAGYKTFNKNCACSINLNMISFIMGL